MNGGSAELLRRGALALHLQAVLQHLDLQVHGFAGTERPPDALLQRSACRRCCLMSLNDVGATHVGRTSLQLGQVGLVVVLHGDTSIAMTSWSDRSTFCSRAS